MSSSAAPASWSPDSAVWRRMAYWGARHGPRPFVRYSPPLIGCFFGLALPHARRRVLRNLRRIYGRRGAFDEARDLASTFATFAACLAESLGGDRSEARQARRRVRGSERLVATLARGKGAIVVTAHVGPWDGAARALHDLVDRPVTLVMEQEVHASAAEFHDGVRATQGIRVVRIGKHPLDALPVLQSLQRGEVVAMQLDRTPAGGRPLRPLLFGQPFSVPRGPFVLSAISGASILPVFSSREGFFDYRIEVGHPVQVSAARDENELDRAASRVVSQMEQFLGQNPTQWFHFAADATGEDLPR